MEASAILGLLLILPCAVMLVLMARGHSHDVAGPRTRTVRNRPSAGGDGKT